MPAVLAATLVVVTIGASHAAKRRVFSAEDLTNIYLGVAYSQWLVGPIARMATTGEIDGYLALQSDEEAEKFIQAFWEERNKYTKWPSPTIRQVFEQRAEEADRLFSEAAYSGRRTDRGAVYVVYGEPEDRTYDLPPDDHQPSIEVWRYSKDAPKGLDGRQPSGFLFRFQKSGDLTRLYLGPSVRGRSRRQG